MAESNDEIAQGYLSRRPEATVRVRIMNSCAYLTVKGLTTGDCREEYEYGIPVEDAERMLTMCEGSILRKTRWNVPYGGHRWEVDVFHGSREGLVIAEIELSSEGEDFLIPPFVGEEVTGNPAYYNSNL